MMLCRARVSVSSMVRSHSRPVLMGKSMRRVSTSASASSTDVADPLAAYHAHQKQAPRLPMAEEVRTLASLAKFTVLCTCDAATPSGDEDQEGGFWPAGSVTGVAFDDEGRAILALSSLSSHTRDLERDARCSLVVMSGGFAGVSDARASLPCKATKLEGDAAAAAREVYLKAHPDAFWVDFGDFSWFAAEVARPCRLVGGFGRAGSVSVSDYASASPDPVKPFAGPVCGHMNADHSEATAAIASELIDLSASSLTSARMDSLDRLGMDVSVVADVGGESVTLPVRVPWPRPAESRADLKTLIVEMTKSAAATATAAANQSTSKEEANTESE